MNGTSGLRPQKEPVLERIDAAGGHFLLPVVLGLPAAGVVSLIPLPAALPPSSVMFLNRTPGLFSYAGRCRVKLYG